MGHLEALGVEGMIIFKKSLKNMMEGRGLNQSGSRKGQIRGKFTNSNETFAFHKM
jgi:hypothetical protein